jgi:hypothetical protein
VRARDPSWKIFCSSGVQRRSRRSSRDPALELEQRALLARVHLAASGSSSSRVLPPLVRIELAEVHDPRLSACFSRNAPIDEEYA